MKSFRIVAAAVAGLLVVLTYFLIQGSAPVAPRHASAQALQAVILHNAALQRDVLRARAGLLPNYDPLVRSMDNLLAAAAALPAARDLANGALQAEIDRRAEAVLDAARQLEALVERFKSDNALLQNSLAYSNHLSGRLAVAGDTQVTAEVGTLTSAMFRFVSVPGADAAQDIRASLDRLAALPSKEGLSRDIRSLVAHGRLVVQTLPAVHGLVARIQAAPTRERAQALQDVYLQAHEREAARADLFLMLLYVAAVALVGYVAYLFMRLRAKARTLRERLDFESLIASISTHFINLPREQMAAGIGEALTRLAEHADVDSARLFVDCGGKTVITGSHNRGPSATATKAPGEDITGLAAGWTLPGYERQGCIQVPDVQALPPGRERTALRGLDIRSWLCIPMWYAGERLGYLTLFSAGRERHWTDDDIALLRTAAQIFANAIARERNESERDALQARLNQSQRLEAIGTLAGGIAHEFNNILGAILGYSEMALVVLRKESAAKRHIEQVMKAGERAQKVVDKVLAFGRRRERERQPLRVEPVIAEAIDLIRASLPATVSVKTRLKAGNATISGDHTELQQVAMNLCTNAAQAMDGRGTLTMELDTIRSEGAISLSHGSLPPGAYVRFAVTDTGKGMDEAMMERIFEPFFTTKPAGKGTGLGLSTVHGIVTDHGGAINVTSRPGEGSTFEVFFPQAGRAVDESDRPPETIVQRGHGETVLILDDEKPLVLLGEEMLAALGYEPVGFERAPAALAAFRADPDRFDLVLTDEVMPDITGTEFAEALHEMRPTLPIVLMTGREQSLQPDRLRAAGIREVLKKPLLSAPMAECLARQLSPA